MGCEISKPEQDLPLLLLKEVAIQTDKQIAPPKTNQDLKWPLPPTNGQAYTLVWPSDFQNYGLKQPSRTKSSIRSNGTKSSDDLDPKTKQVQWSVKHPTERTTEDICDGGLVHVQSNIESQSNANINLLKKVETDRSLGEFDEVYECLHRNLKERGQNILTQSKDKICMIINDTQTVQQGLMEFVKEQQELNEKLYDEWLQKYITQLNKWKAARLAELERKTEAYHKSIQEHLQNLIDSVNNETIRLQREIVKEEDDLAANSAKKIAAGIYMTSVEGFGIESSKKINLKVIDNTRMSRSGLSDKDKIEEQS